MAPTPTINPPHNYVQALTISTIDQGNESCLDISRTMPQIISSCLTMIFLCTWVAHHPDVPSPGEGKFKNYVGRGLMLVVMLIAPEIAIAKALADFIAARKWAERYKGYGWTLTHGFFAKMGGFALYEGGTLVRSLDPSELGSYLQRGEICVTTEEIRDKSKGSALAKTFVLIRTAWFILQFSVRGVQKLPVTELELATLSFAVLNFLIFTIWWKKPFKVDFPIPVYRGIPTSQSVARANSSCDLGQEDRESFKGATDPDNTEPSGDNSRSPSVDGGEVGHKDDAVRSDENTLSPSLTKLHADGEKIGRFSIFGDIVLGFLSRHGYLIPFCAGTIFGLIHCAAWSYQFPTLVERDIWRACSVFMTVSIPTLSLSMVSRHDILRKTSIWVIAILYVLARLALLVLTFTTLRSLPPGALVAVRWTTFIPHN